MSVSNFVESVEYIEINVGISDTDVSQDLSKGQNYENCVPFMTNKFQDANVYEKLFDIYFSGTTSSGTINFSRLGTGSYGGVIKCYVVEFISSEVSVQQGTFTIGSSSQTDTITFGTPVSSTAKAAYTFAWETSNTVNTLGQNYVKGNMTSVSGIEFYRGLSTTYTIEGHWFMFEDIGDNFSVTHIDNSITTSDSFKFVSIDSGRWTNPLSTFLLGSSTSTFNSAYLDRNTFSIGLASPSTVYCYKSYTSGGTGVWNAQVVEFTDQSKVYTPFYHGTSIIATDSLTINTSAYNDLFCNLDTSGVVCAGMQGHGHVNGATTTYQQEIHMTVELTSSGTLELTRPSAVYDHYASYTVAVDWAGITVSSGTNSNVIPEGTGQGQSFVKSVENFQLAVSEKMFNRQLTKGQNWQNCCVFSSFVGTSSSMTDLDDVVVLTTLLEPGVIYVKTATNAYTKNVSVSVVEFWPNQVNVQHKYADVSSSADNSTYISIDPVSNTNKAFITSSFYTDQNSYYPAKCMPRVTFSGTGAVEFYVANNSSYATLNNVAAICIVEDLGSNFEVFHGTSDFYINYDSITNYDGFYPPFICFPLYSYSPISASSYSSRSYISGDNIHEFKPLSVYKYDASAGYTIYWAGSAILFLDSKDHVVHVKASITTGSTVTGNLTGGFLTNKHAVTPINTEIHSSAACSAAAAATYNCYVNVKISDEDTGEYQISRVSSSYYTQVYAVFIDWIGTEGDTSASIKTKSLIQSLEIFSDDNADGYNKFSLTKGQNIQKCVPFYQSSVGSSNCYPARFYKNIYRIDDNGSFIVRNIMDQEFSRPFTLNVVEFNDNVTVQYGYDYFTGTSKTVTINSVNLDRAFLIFYSSSDNSALVANSAFSTCGHFTSASGIEFVRYSDDSNVLLVSWYVVECTDEDDYWTVQHIYNTSLGANATIEVDMDYLQPADSSFLITSWTTDNTATSYASRSYYKVSHTITNSTQLIKSYNGAGSMFNLNIEAVTFSENVVNKGAFTSFAECSLVNGETVVDVTLPVASGVSFDLNRSIVINASSNGESNVQSISSAVSWEAGSLEHKFYDGNTIRASRYYSSYWADSFVYAVQFPEYNKYYMEGYVKQEGLPVSRTVVAYRTSTKEEVDRTTSASGTGYFWLETPYGGNHFVIAFDDDVYPSYNHLIYGKLVPTVISGSFAYNEGLVTTSGFEIGIPLARQ